jgi:hypothetical protein
MSDERPLWREHFSLLVTGAAFSVFVLRLLAMAHGDPETAAAIVHTTGPANALFGIAVQDGALVVVAGAWVTIVVRFTQRPDRRLSWLFVGELATVIGAAAAVGPIVGAVGMVTFTVIWLVANAGAQRGQGLDRVMLAIFVWTVGTMGALVVATGFVNDQMWLPPERLTMDPSTKVVGYVLDRDESELVVLDDHSRTVRRIDATDVSDRTICRKHDADTWSTRSLLAVFRTRPDYPRC